MDFEKLYNEIWANTLSLVHLKPKELHKLNINNINSYLQEIWIEIAQSEKKAFFLEPPLIRIEKNLKKDEKPYYILVETKAILPECSCTQEMIKSYYFEKANIIEDYRELLKFFAKSCERAKKDEDSLLHIYAMLNLIYGVYQLDKEELKNYLLKIQSFLQGKEVQVDKNITFPLLIDFVRSYLSGYSSFDFTKDFPFQESLIK